MSKNSTNSVGQQLLYARENGIIPWSWIVDETRREERPAIWADPEQYADVVQRSYRRNRWLQQESRYRWYVERYGRHAWELDAMSPPVLRDRVEQAIRGYIDMPTWERAEKVETIERASLVDVLTAWKAAAA